MNFSSRLQFSIVILPPADNHRRAKPVISPYSHYQAGFVAAAFRKEPALASASAPAVCIGRAGIFDFHCDDSGPSVTSFNGGTQISATTNDPE
jgi:hypothetical protein